MSFTITSIAAWLPSRVQAQGLITGTTGCDFAGGEVHADCVIDFIAHVIGWIFGFTGGIAVVMIIIAGYQMALGKVIGQDTSAGKDRLTWALVGLAVSILAIAIIDFFISTLI